MATGLTIVQPEGAAVWFQGANAIVAGMAVHDLTQCNGDAGCVGADALALIPGGKIGKFLPEGLREQIGATIARCGESIGGSRARGFLASLLRRGAAKESIGIDENAAGHIFTDKSGHLAEDTLANRKLLTDTANQPSNYLGTDARGSRWYAQTRPDGTQVWARVQNGGIRSGGVNPSPGKWNPKTGLSRQ